MLDLATARTLKAQLKQVYNGEAKRTKRVPITKEDIVLGKDGQLRTKIPYYADQGSRASRNRAVYFGRRWLTARGGLDKTQLEPNGSGRIVSKAARAEALRRGDFGKKWREAVAEACEQLGIERYTIPKKGSALYTSTLAIYQIKKESPDKEANAAVRDEDGGETKKGLADGAPDPGAEQDSGKAPGDDAAGVPEVAVP